MQMSLKEAPQTPDYIRSVDGRWGKTYFVEKDAYVGKSLQSYGEYNPDETEMLLFLAHQAGREKLILDIGANVGVMAQALARNGYRVEAFEPQPAIFEILRMNFSGKCHNVAVGRDRKTTLMPVVRYDEPNNFGALPCDHKGPLGSFEVPVVPLDSLSYRDIGLIKIDVEGYEEEVLRGAGETIARCRPLIYLEDDRVDKSASLRQFLRGLAYQWVEHKPQLFRAENFFGNRENAWDKLYASHNLLCYPKTI